jgi:hypothetical protein
MLRSPRSLGCGPGDVAWMRAAHALHLTVFADWSHGYFFPP